jgi:predicted neuraminidase
MATGIIKEFCLAPSSRYPSMHASTICELPDGALLVACYAGEREGSPDSVVLGTRREAGARGWASPEVWVDVAGRAPANPRLFVGPDERLWLLVGVNYGKWCSGDTYLFVKRSATAGREWTDLELLVEQKGLLGRNRPYNKGSIWLIPTEWETSWSAAFLRSEDGGRSWKVVGDLGRTAGAHLIQPAIVELPDGRLLAFFRSQEGHIYRSYSPDLGKTWSNPEPTPLPNNNSGIELIRLRSGLLALIYNPTSADRPVAGLGDKWPAEMPVGFERWGPRTPLVVDFSPDWGESWPWRITLEEGPGEYSYPSAVQSSDGTLHITYTYNREAIMHVAIPEAVLADLGALDRGIRPVQEPASS